MKNNDIVITRIFDVSQKKLFDAWTTPKHIKKWWGPEHFTAPYIDIDLKVGGKYLYCMQGPDGKKYYSGGIFKELEIPKRIVILDYFTDEKGNKIDPSIAFGMEVKVPKESLVTVTFEDIKGKTKLSIIYNLKSAQEKKALEDVQMLEGWDTSLDKLAKYVEKT